MKMKYILAGGLLFGFGLVSCLDDAFLDRTPIDKEVESTVFTTYDNFKMYGWGLYKDYITGYRTDLIWGMSRICCIGRRVRTGLVW